MIAIGSACINDAGDPVRRREFIAGLAGGALWPTVGRSQKLSTVRQVGHLSGGTEAGDREVIAAFVKGMGDLGYREGQSFVLTARYAEGKFDRLPLLARELLALNPEVLFVATTPGSLAAKAATTTVPIVIAGVADPVGVGIVQTLAKPGGNITGITNIVAELTGKRLALLKQIVPSASKVAVLINPDDPNASIQMRNASNAARDLAVELQPVLHIRGAGDLEGVFASAAAARADAGLRMVDPLTNPLSKQTAELALKYRLPVIYPFRISVENGGLISYGTDIADQYRQAATLVHKILNGAKPADLPVEQPTKFELTINLRTAKELGISIPEPLLATADRVIE
jgi:putative tryptophan/tyrosine transport system substrate-binding protein